jgi:uncharacterized protein YggE
MEITVAGTGTASLRPERATVHLTAGFEGPEPQSAKERTAELVQRLAADVARLRAADPSPTTWSAVLPVRTFSWRPFSDKGNLTPLVHRALAEVRVKFRDVGALARFVDAWAGVDGITIAGVRWTLTEATRQAQERRVLTQAVEQARARALVIAAAAGAGDVRIVEVADPGLLAGDRRGTAPPSAVAARSGAADAGAVDLAPEDIEISAVVHARFATTG